MPKRIKAAGPPATAAPLRPGSPLYRLGELVAAEIARDLDERPTAPRSSAGDTALPPTRRSLKRSKGA